MPVENPNKQSCFGMVTNIIPYPVEGNPYQRSLICRANIKLNNGEIVKVNILEEKRAPLGMRMELKGLVIEENEIVKREVMQVPNIFYTDVPAFLRDYTEGILEFFSTQVEVVNA